MLMCICMFGLLLVAWTFFVVAISTHVQTHTATTDTCSFTLDGRGCRQEIQTGPGRPTKLRVAVCQGNIMSRVGGIARRLASGQGQELLSARTKRGGARKHSFRACGGRHDIGTAGWTNSHIRCCKPDGIIMLDVAVVLFLPRVLL